MLDALLGNSPDPKPVSDDPAVIFRWAVRNVTVEGPNGPRSLAYYASVGIDAFNHEHGNLDALIERVAQALSHKSA